MTSPFFLSFFYIYIPASLTVGVKTWSSLLFLVKVQEKQGWKRWLNTFLLSSVRPYFSPLLSLVLPCDFHIYIFLIYIFLQGIKQTHRHDEFIVLKHIKGRGGREKGRGSPFKVITWSVPRWRRDFEKDPAPDPGLARGRRAEGGGGGELEPLCYYVIWCGASSISMRKVSMGVSPMSLKKNKCSRHLRPMERSAGNRSNSLANLSQHKTKIRHQGRDGTIRLSGRGRGGGVILKKNNPRTGYADKGVQPPRAPATWTSQPVLGRHERVIHQVSRTHSFLCSRAVRTCPVSHVQTACLCPQGQNLTCS